MSTYQPIRSTGFFKYLTTNSTGMTDINDGFTVTRPDNLIRLQQAGVRFRGVELVLFGAGANNQTMTCEVQIVREVKDWGTLGGEPGFVLTLTRQYLLEVVTVISPATFGALQGTAGSYITNTDFVCDTIIQARTLFGTALESAFAQTSVINSPANDTVASYWLPDLGDADYLRLQLDNGTGTNANALVSLYI